MFISSKLVQDQRVRDGVRPQPRSGFMNFLYPEISGIFYCGKLKGDNSTALEEACHSTLIGGHHMNVLCFLPKPTVSLLTKNCWLYCTHNSYCPKIK